MDELGGTCSVGIHIAAHLQALLLGLLQHIGAAVVKARVRADDLASRQQVRRLLAHRGHDVRILDLDGNALGLVKLVEGGP